MVDAENVDIVYSQWHPGPLDDGDAILQFTATPRDSSKPVVVAPVTDLYLGLDQYPFPDVDLVSAIEQLHHYVRHEVIGSYFEYGIIPPVHQTLSDLSRPHDRLTLCRRVSDREPGCRTRRSRVAGGPAL